MGRYVNPDNGGFAEILRDEYVDKTGLVSLFDSTLNKPRKLVMVSRPRRFGKSFAAQALVAFYSCGCDSRTLFEGLEVSRRDGWDKNLNAYNVLSLDMAEVMQLADGRGVEAEVEELCQRSDMDVAEVRRWYDGYDLPAFRPAPGEPSHVGVYAPYSVMQACERGATGSYWPSTETFEELRRELRSAAEESRHPHVAQVMHDCRILEAR